MIRVSRFIRLVKKQEFLQKNFSEYELAHYVKKNQLQTLAGMFCAKEAFLKAVGVGVLNGIKLSEVEVRHEHNGQPLLKLPERVLKDFKIKSISVSITHDSGFAAAACVVD